MGRRGGQRRKPGQGRVASAPLPVVPLLGLLLMILVVYWRVFFAGFVWDDNRFIVEEAAVGEWAGLWDIWLRPELLLESHYWPVLYTVFWLEHKLWGFNPAGFHAVNLLLHGVNCVLLWYLLRRMLLPGALFIAGVFALHPVHVEAVAWIIARKDLLATLFYFLAFACWLNYRELQEGRQGRQHRRRGERLWHGSQQRRLYIALMLLYTLAVLSKSVVLTLPLVLLLWLWWQHGRISGRDLQQVMPLLLWGLLLGAYGFGRYTATGVIEVEHSFPMRLLIAAKALWFYAGKLLWPESLLFIYPRWDTSWNVSPQQLMNWLPLVAAVALAAGLYFSRQRLGRGPLTGALFFAITLSPTLGFLPFRFMEFSFVADRYQYLAMAGIVAVLVSGAVQGLEYVSRHSKQTKHAGMALAVLLLVVYGVLSHERSKLFQDQVVLFRHVVDTNPGAHESGHILGTFLMERQQWQQAEAVYKAALLYEPQAVKIHANLGSVLMAQERHQEAADIMQEAVLLEPADLGLSQESSRVLNQEALYEAAAVRANLGLALMHLERLAEAEVNLRRALELQPDSAAARHNLTLLLGPQAVAHFDGGRMQQALSIFEEIARLTPEDAQAHANLGSALGRLGRYEEAAVSLQRALAIDPQLESARVSLEAARQQIDTASPSGDNGGSGTGNDAGNDAGNDSPDN